MDIGQIILWLFWNFDLEKKKWNEKHSEDSSLLKDYAYLKEIKENVAEEQAIILYDRKEMHNIPIFGIQFTISDQLFLDVSLMETRSKITAYATMKKKRK